MRSQSAMEYLMTYGWSILIVAVVLGALAYLGVFNPLYFAPKANPGSCQVFRPNGAGTSYDINLLGVCDNEIPRYVANFNSVTTYSPGCSTYGASSSSCIISNSVLFGSDIPFTVTAWVNVEYFTSGISWTVPFLGFANYQGFGFIDTAPSQDVALVIHRCSSADTCSNGGCGTGSAVINDGITASTQSIMGKWTFVAYSVNQPNYYFQVNDQSANVTNPNGYGNSAMTMIGGQFQSCDGNPFEGQIANVQIYNASLDSKSISAIYQEGIGGAPIDLQNLVGWWPLNGNANDYSGNGNGGLATNVLYTDSWITGYTPQ